MSGLLAKRINVHAGVTPGSIPSAKSLNSAFQFRISEIEDIQKTLTVRWNYRQPNLLIPGPWRGYPKFQKFRILMASRSFKIATFSQYTFVGSDDALVLVPSPKQKRCRIKFLIYLEWFFFGSETAWSIIMCFFRFC